MLRFKYSDSNLRTAEGMFVANRNPLVCYWKSNTVRLVSQDGIYSKDFFKNNDEIIDPYSVSFRESDATQVVIFRNKNHILASRLK